MWWCNVFIYVMGFEVCFFFVLGVGVGIEDGFVELGCDVVGVVK